MKRFGTSDKAKNKPTQFRQRYEMLEVERRNLLERLAKVGESGRAHSGFNSASRLLNQQFRRATLVQRVAILQAANWMIDLLEQLASML
jgi:hypothetical protein